MVFQFHKGTIKPAKKMRLGASWYTYFNSIKVRLNPQAAPLARAVRSISIP